MEFDGRTLSQQLIAILEKLIDLLYSTEGPSAHMFGSYFEKMLAKLKKPHEVYRIAEELKSIFGGMGSFNDLVLYKNREVLKDAQKELDKLSDHLYELVNGIIVEHRGGYMMQHPDGDYFISFDMADKIKNGEEVPEEILRKLNGEVE